MLEADRPALKPVQQEDRWDSPCPPWELAGILKLDTPDYAGFAEDGGKRARSLRLTTDLKGNGTMRVTAVACL